MTLYYLWLKLASFVASVSYAVTWAHSRLNGTLYGDLNLGTELARYEANADFQRDYYKRRKLAGRSPGNDDKVSIICFPHKLKIEYCNRGLKTELEYYRPTPFKKGLYFAA